LSWQGFFSNGILHVRNGLRGKYPSVMSVWQQWWKDEHAQLGIKCVPLIIEYHENYGKIPGDDIQQLERPLTCCGASAVMHGYYEIVEGRVAHAKDFSYDHINEIRLFLADSIIEHGISNDLLDHRVSPNDFDAFCRQKYESDASSKADIEVMDRAYDELSKKEIIDLQDLQDKH
jgi:hypothetical protein